MPYYVGEHDVAIELFDRYVMFEKRHGRTPSSDLKELREQLANKDIQRQG